jgi:hypothetical protein
MATITAKLLVARPYKKDTLPAGADPKHASSCLLAHRALTSQNAVTHELELRRIPLPRTPVNKGKRKGRGTRFNPGPIAALRYALHLRHLTASVRSTPSSSIPRYTQPRPLDTSGSRQPLS